MMKDYRFALCLMFAIWCSAPAHADDLGDIADQLAQIAKTETDIYGNTMDIVKTGQQQYTQAMTEWTAMTQSYGMKDTSADQTARLWSADQWDSVLQQASGGNNARFQELMQSYSNKYPILKDANQTINPAQLAGKTYTEEGQTYNAALSSSNYTYSDINTRIKKTENLLAEVDDVSKNQNQKAATDLNSRLVAEQNFNQLELLKTLSVQLQMDAMKNQKEYNNETLDKQFTHYQPTS